MAMMLPVVAIRPLRFGQRLLNMGRATHCSCLRDLKIILRGRMVRHKCRQDDQNAEGAQRRPDWPVQEVRTSDRC